MAVELTFPTSTICAALSRALPMNPEIKADVLYTNKARGHWPIKEEGRGWTRYSLIDATRLLVQLELNRGRGVHIGIATSIARAEHVKWPEADAADRFLVYTEVGVERKTAEGIGEMFSSPPSVLTPRGRLHTTSHGGIAYRHFHTNAPLIGCSAIVVDAVEATARMKAALAAVEVEEPKP